eukprot:COSAG04_NODE_1471_length_6586_cov_1.959149_8_plen_293_part_00
MPGLSLASSSLAISARSRPAGARGCSCSLPRPALLSEHAVPPPPRRGRRLRKAGGTAPAGARPRRCSVLPSAALAIGSSSRSSRTYCLAGPARALGHDPKVEKSPLPDMADLEPEPESVWPRQGQPPGQHLQMDRSSRRGMRMHGMRMHGGLAAGLLGGDASRHNAAAGYRWTVAFLASALSSLALWYGVYLLMYSRLDIDSPDHGSPAYDACRDGASEFERTVRDSWLPGVIGAAPGYVKSLVISTAVVWALYRASGFHRSGRRCCDGALGWIETLCAGGAADPGGAGCVC